MTLKPENQDAINFIQIVAGIGALVAALGFGCAAEGIGSSTVFGVTTVDNLLVGVGLGTLIGSFIVSPLVRNA